MSPNILLQIEKWIKESDLLNEREITKFIAKIRSLKKGKFILPGSIMSSINLSMDKAYRIFELLKEKGIIVENYELYCHECDKYNVGRYEHYTDIPETVECGWCRERLERKSNVIVIYKVIKDD